jgi:dihydroorotate dehydrogenase
LEFSPYKSLIRPAIFLTNPEKAHGIASWFFKQQWLWYPLRRRLDFEDEALQVEIGSLNLRNPIGLAAGFDKNCEMARTLEQFGFGYLTLGTITLNPREGNPKPRVWRRPGNSLINSMGLPNVGANQIVHNLANNTREKTRDTPLIVSVSGLSQTEFVECYRLIEPLVDGIELNISSPNTTGVRIFQEPSALSELLDEVGKLRSNKNPIWVKIPPYFDEQERENVLGLVDVCMRKSVDAITAINTKRIEEPRANIGTAGLSGPPIFQDMIRIVGEIYNQTEGKIPINACGGISSAMDVWRALESGASSVQVYTAFVYEGPSLVSKMNRKLLRMLHESKLTSVSQIRGSASR